MPVDEDIDLNKPLTDAQIRKLEREAEKLEQAAEKAERAAEKINTEVRQASANLLEAEKFMGTSPLAGMGGDDEASTSSNFLGLGATGVDDDILPSKGRRSEQGKAKTSTAFIESSVIEETAKLEREANKKRIKELSDNQKKIIQEQKEEKLRQQRIMSMAGETRGNISQAFSFKQNPTGFVQDKLMNVVGRAGFAGAMAVIAFSAGQQVYNQIMNEVKELFRAGGALDARKDTLNALAEVSSIDTIVDNNQARVFFTSSTGEILRQGVPQDYNTRNRVNGYKQYLQEYDR